MRIDRFLWFARLSASRAYAQSLAASGHLRIDGRATAKPATAVGVGTVLTFATHSGVVRVLRIEALPRRRGPAPEAHGCYTELNAPIDGSRAQS